MSEYEVLQVQAQPQVMQIDALERANVDSQVATAKQYPRDIRRSIDNSIVMATMDKETAQSCGMPFHGEINPLPALLSI